MLKQVLACRRIRLLVRLVLTVFVLTGCLSQGAKGSAYYSLNFQNHGTVSPSPVILQEGTAGMCTVYTNMTSAKASVSAENETNDYVDNDTSNVDNALGRGNHSNFTTQKFEDSVFDKLTESDTTSFLVKKGAFTKATSTGAQIVSGVGFQPKAVVFWWTRQTSYGELGSIRAGYGTATYYDGTYQNFGVAFASDDAAFSSNAGRHRSATYSVIILSTGTPTMVARASVTAFSSDGFSLNWQTNENRADIIQYAALGGSDLANAKAGNFSLAAAAGTQDVSGLGFQPDFAMFLWTFTEAVDTSTADGEVGIGFAVSSTKMGAIVANSRDNQMTMDTWQQQRTDACILLLTPSSGAQDAIASFSSFLTDGFRLNITDAPATAVPIFYLALKGGNYDVGSFSSPTSTGTQDVTTIGFQAELLMLATQGRSAATTIGSTAELALGAATSSTEEGCAWWEDPDNLFDSDNEMETSNTRIIQWRDRTAANTFTLRGSADFVSFLTNGFRLSWTSVSIAARQVIYVAFGIPSNYELDLEEQWTNADYAETNEELAIYAYKGSNTYSLDATGGYMRVGDGTPNWGSTTGTISFWVKWDAVGNRPWGQHENMEIRFAGSQLVLDWGASISLTSGTSFISNKWYFIATVWNENTDDLYIYVGDLSNSPAQDAFNGAWTSAVSTVGVTGNNFMASKGGVNPTDGKGDDLRYWNTDRSLAQLQSDYDSELTGAETGLRSYFKLNNNFDDIGPSNNDGSGSGSYSFSSDVPFEAPPSESIRVDAWNGAAWQNLFTDLSSGWNNISISSYLTSSTFTIRFKGSSETGDTVQDSWKIDASLLHVWSFFPVTTYDYVLKINNTVASSWQARLSKYSESSIARLQNCTIFFHNSTDGTSLQIQIINGAYTQQYGSWYDLPPSATIYIAVTVEADGPGTSHLFAYLEILTPGTTTYARHAVTFEVT